MAKPFDATTKYLLEHHPQDWLQLVGISDAQAEIIDANLSTITSESDKVLRVTQDETWLLHTEMQAGYESRLPNRVDHYNALLRYRHDLGVQSVVILLRPEADGPAITGRIASSIPARSVSVTDYDVIRLWQVDVEKILSGGLGTLPLALLAGGARGNEPETIDRMQGRISREADRADAAALWSATYVLMGLTYSPGDAERLLEGVRGMRESATYQAILAEGRQEGRQQGREEGREEGAAAEARTILLLLGSKFLGEPGEDVRQTIAALTSVERLHTLINRMTEVEGWDVLLRE